MPMSIPADSLLAHLQTLDDPRRRAGRRYPLAGILGALILGTLNGHSSGSGAWDWARQHWGQIWRPLGFRSPHCPVYTTVWNLLQTLDADALDQLIASWLEMVLGHPLGGLSADGKTLRGSRRGALAGLKLVSVFQHKLGVVLGQQQVPDGQGEQASALAVLGSPSSLMLKAETRGHRFCRTHTKAMLSDGCLKAEGEPGVSTYASTII